MNYQHWILEIDGRVARLKLNRPQEKNRIGATTLNELALITQFLEKRSDIWVVILEAIGDCFSAGVDVSLIGQMIGQDRKNYAHNLRQSQAVFDAFEKLEKPVIAGLHGYCIGGGLILALCCDFRIASENTIIALPEVKRSIGVVMGTQRISRVAGIAATKELVMLGNNIDAGRAYQFGLLNEVVPNENLNQRLNEFAQQFLDLPPLAVGICKRIINEGQFLERAGQDLEIAAQAELLDTQDFKEAIASFFEKRKPDFQGK